MTAILSWAVGNPMVILAMIGVFTFTSIGSEVKGWFTGRAAVRSAVTPWVKAVAKRDRAAAAKEQILSDTRQAKADAEQIIAELNAAFEAAEIKRRLAGVDECHWTDDDIRMLNAGDRGSRATGN